MRGIGEWRDWINYLWIDYDNDDDDSNDSSDDYDFFISFACLSTPLLFIWKKVL